MAKEIVKKFKLQAPGGQATPAPPVGPALGANGVNPGQFITQFNAATKALNGMVVTVEITTFSDRTFTFEVKSPPASALLKAAAGAAKGSGTPNKDKVGKVTRAQVREIAKTKMKDLNAFSIEAAEKVIMGSAKNMGIEVTD
jgi:large subunit ribosomal protein L11